MKTRACLPVVEVSAGKVVRGYAEAFKRVADMATPRGNFIMDQVVCSGRRYTFTIKGEPMGKPRMTRSDKWKKRDCVMRYRTWADAARAAFGKTEKIVLTQPTTLSIIAYFPIPDSWSRFKKDAAKNMPHTVTPDGDNVMKGLKDALFHNDQMVVDGWYRKLYDDGRGARIEVTIDA